MSVVERPFGPRASHGRAQRGKNVARRRLGRNSAHDLEAGRRDTLAFAAGTAARARVPVALSELETAFDAVGGERLQLLAAMGERKLQMPQVLGHVAFLHRGPLRDLASGERGLTQGVRDALAHGAAAFQIRRRRRRRRMPRAAVGHGAMLRLRASRHEPSRRAAQFSPLRSRFEVRLTSGPRRRSGSNCHRYRPRWRWSNPLLC